MDKQELEKNIQVYQETLFLEWEELPPMFVSSAEKKTGKEELLDYIGEIVEDNNV